MKFVCDRCQTKYSIADERVRGKVLKVKCKSCANVITVREARAHSSAGVPTLSSGGAGHSRGGAQAALSVPMETPGVDSERTQLAMSPFGAETEGFPDLLEPAAPSAPVRRPTGALAAVGPGDDLVQWYMALEGNRTGPFTRTKLVERLAPLAKSADVHIWNEKLDGWKPPAAIPEIAAEINRRRAPAPPPPPLPMRRPTPPPMPPLGGSGGWVDCRTASRRASRPGRTRRRRQSRTRPSRRDRSCRRRAAFIRRSPPEVPSTAPTRHRCWRRRRPSRTICRTRRKTNGANGHAPPKAVNSDVMQMLNMPGGTQTAPGAPPRLMSVTDATGWAASAETKGRGKSRR